MSWHSVSQRRYAVKLLGLLLSLSGLLYVQTAVALDNIYILLSEEGSAYTEFAVQLNNLLTQAGTTKNAVKVFNLANYKSEDLPRTANNHLLIAVGTPAMTAMAQKPPAMAVLNVLVSRDSFQKIARQYNRHQDPHHFSAIYFDQPWQRQLNLVRTVLPGRNRIGILLSKDASDMMAGLQTASKDLDLQINVETVNDDSELLPALRRLLNNSDSLLALPDASIYNRNNIPSILLTSYRQKVPLFGFSAAYVKAGALAAVFSSPAQIAQQVADIIPNLPNHAYLPSPQYPRHFSVNINSQVSRSLSIDVEDEATLTRKLRSTLERVQ
ncbi:ABC transporter substrate-binding protein [Undibacterium sp. Di27W]|uniref:ABC transporter substrate-binding protein n=1 Tax=Undibacterium sp. Di27W TaxID=3413036 RepID=UPI003BF13991